MTQFNRKLVRVSSLALWTLFNGPKRRLRTKQKKLWNFVMRILIVDGECDWLKDNEGSEWVKSTAMLSRLRIFHHLKWRFVAERPLFSVQIIVARIVSQREDHLWIYYIRSFIIVSMNTESNNSGLDGLCVCFQFLKKWWSHRVELAAKQQCYQHNVLVHCVNEWSSVSAAFGKSSIRQLVTFSNQKLNVI